MVSKLDALVNLGYVEGGGPLQRSDKIASLLATIPLFASLAERDLLELAHCFRPRSFAKGEAVVHHQDKGYAFFVLIEGSVKVTRPLATGAEVVINVLDAGEFFGELALLDGRPRSASVYALEPTQVVMLHRRDFAHFLHSHPNAAREIIVVLADRIRRLNDRIEDLVARDLPGRLARRLLEWARKRGEHTPDGVKVHVPMTQAEMAGMVGVSRQRLNRLLGEWQDQQIIRIERRNEFIILEPSTLEAFCQ